MAKRMTFGKTWWGRQWVEAMERIDSDTNRLPRGRRYAKGGMVREIQVQEGRVLAKVQGSRPRPYNIEIALKRFDPKRVQKIQRIIQNNTDMGSELLLGSLPERLLEALNKEKIHLLPSHWSEIEASCSCPDWANPCKHLAAVYYIIANEIDKDPFILLNLRGAPKKDISGVVGLSPHTGEAAPKDSFIAYSKITLPASSSSLNEPDRSLDLSFERLAIETLFALLLDKPLFYPDGDFKPILLHVYQKVIEQIGALEIQENGPYLKETEFYILHHPDDYSLFVCPPGTLNASLPLSKGNRARRNVEESEKVYAKMLPVRAGNKLQLSRKKGRSVNPGAVFDLFLSLPLDINPVESSPSARCLNIASSIALSFIRAASFIPEVIQYRDGDFAIRYVPLIHDEKAKRAVSFLADILPPYLIFREKDKTVLSGEGGAYYLLSLMISHVVHRFAEMEIRDKLCDAAFRGKPYIAEKFEERHTSKALTDWLERLSVRKRDLSPVIRIESVDKGFSVNIDIEDRKDPLAPLIPLSHLFSNPMEPVRTEVLRQVVIAAEYMPCLKAVVNRKGKKNAAIDPQAMAEFLTHAEGILNLLGIRVVIPRELKNLITPRLSIKANLKGAGETISYLSLDRMLDFSWQVAIGDEAISREEFLTLVKKAEGIVWFKDRYLLLKPEEVRGIMDRLQKPLPALTSMATLQAALTGEMDGMLFHPGEALRKVLEDLTKPEEIEIPSTLQATLRPYQERGFRWLYTNTKRGFGSCLADDMGLGKTIQVISLLLKLKHEGWLPEPALVICPTTLAGNWQKECERFAPSLKTTVYHGTERRLDVPSASGGHDLVITTYGILRRDIERFKGQRWAAVIIDEAQNIKNPAADQTRAVKALKANALIAMSGTPVENRLTELWSIFDFTNQGYLGPIDRFKRQYAIPIEKYRDQERIKRLQKATAPFMLRRLKTDKTIISDLPEKLVVEEYCYLTKEQAGLYQQVVESCMREIETREGIERKGLIFKLITGLKQICNHPVHYLKKGKVEKEKSGKAEKALSIIEKVITAGEKVLIFSQYREMGDLLVDLIRTELDQTPLFFHGGVVRSKRDQLVEEFQGSDRHRVMILSLKAGGTGLNLTAATHVVHYDLWWNPAVEAQATDRTYRIGQRQNVMVHRLITLGTFEERIDEMIKAKKELADLTVATGEQWITELSNRELKEIFSLSSGS